MEKNTYLIISSIYIVVMIIFTIWLIQIEIYFPFLLANLLVFGLYIWLVYLSIIDKRGKENGKNSN
jgi:4-hydroxybenzoate polyprenyltransferase